LDKGGPAVKICQLGAHITAANSAPWQRKLNATPTVHPLQPQTPTHNPPPHLQCAVMAELSDAVDGARPDATSAENTASDCAYLPAALQAAMTTL
jgi:hypothetical protein